jgi:flagellar basal-body rod protein FlgC
MFDILSISGSGMHAQTVRLNAVASNMANAEAISSNANETYKAKVPKFQAILDESMKGYIAKGGVKVKEIIENQAEARAEYNPDHPMANDKGYIYRPNVDTIEEMANMISASRSYEMNIEVLNTSKQLMMKTLQLGSGA